MDAGDDTTDDSLASLSPILESLESNRNEDQLSPEDIAWIDSCIVKDPEVLDQHWESLKNALLEILDNESEALNSSATSGDGLPSENDINMLSYSEEAEILNLEGDGGNLSVVPTHEELVKEVNGMLSKKEIGLLLQASGENDMESFHEDPFLPTYKEEENEGEVVDSVSKLDSATDETGLPTDDIFRVWDLDIPSEEADLAKQLNKALEETSFQFVPSTSDDSRAWKELKEESIDNLIAGLGDLSLNKNSGGV